MPATTQYLQVPKFAQTRRSRSRSKSRQRDAPREVFSSPTEVVVSPQKLSFRPRSPEPVKVPSFKPEPYRRPTTSIHALKTTPPVKMVDRPIPSPYATDDSPACSPPPTPAPVIALPKDSLSSGGTNYDDLNEDVYTVEQTLPPPEPKIPLRQKLVGAWKLESYIAYPTPESPVQRPTYPMTRNVTGFIMYTPDGYMSAQMLIPGQQSFKRGEGEEPQWAEAGKRCFAYCGPYYINNEGPGREEILRHTFQCCNLPGWIGDIQVRTHRFEENGQVLVLGSEEPTEVKVCKSPPSS